MLETIWESRWLPDLLVNKEESREILKLLNINEYGKYLPTWGCSSVGRAPALQAGGQEFESLHLHAKHELCTNERTRRRRACMKAFECVHPYRATLVTK